MGVKVSVELELTETQRRIEEMHRNEELDDSAIARRVGVSRKYVVDTLDLPMHMFRPARTSQREKLAAEQKTRPRRFESAPWHTDNMSDVTFRPFASDAIKGAMRSPSP